ncbi:MAG: Fluoroquinolones export ATP-binding protein [Dehalococcoidia bacterium]|nr:Fluoroquinolones export ATP-binding protein [Chloroflexota bacterium]
MKGVDLNIAKRGEVFGLLGPNGAGKTTLVEILVGLRRADKGFVRVLGLDPVHQRPKLLQHVGIQTQEFAVQPKVTCLEALKFFASLYPNPLDVHETLEQLELKDKTNSYFAKLSGGQKKRLSLAKTLIGNTPLMILDEPTTGLDAQGHAFLIEQIRKSRVEGRTVLLTTHDIHDAELLCDGVAIIDRGQIIAEGSPAELIVQNATKGYVRVESRDSIPDYPWEEIRGVRKVYPINQNIIIIYCDNPQSVSDVLQEQRIADRSDGLRTEIGSTTLEDVFLMLTGRSLRE